MRVFDEWREKGTEVRIFTRDGNYQGKIVECGNEGIMIRSTSENPDEKGDLRVLMFSYINHIQVIEPVEKEELTLKFNPIDREKPNDDNEH